MRVRKMVYCSVSIGLPAPSCSRRTEFPILSRTESDIITRRRPRSHVRRSLARFSGSSSDRMTALKAKRVNRATTTSKRTVSPLAADHRNPNGIRVAAKPRGQSQLILTKIPFRSKSLSSRIDLATKTISAITTTASPVKAPIIRSATLPSALSRSAINSCDQSCQWKCERAEIEGGRGITKNAAIASEQTSADASEGT